MSAETEYEWVEILEPESHRKMYANVVSGECLWEPPAGVPVKANHENQWWELVDGNTSRSYYYNATNQSTVWERPTTGDIVRLAKLQQMQEELAKMEQESNDDDMISPAKAPAGSSSATSAASVSTASTTTAATNSEPTSSSPPAGAASSSAKRTAPTGRLADFGDIDQHKKGIIFKKKVSIATMLRWSKECIPSPMLMTLKKTHRKDAIDVFKMVQMCMGDRKSRHSSLQTTVAIIGKCWTEPVLRDELFLQLCKQTTETPQQKSLEKGWELLCISLTFFPPSKKFFNYLEGYIYKHTTKNQAELITGYTQFCLRKLPRIQQVGAKRGVDAPKLAEVEQAKTSIFNPSVFGSTLEDVMEVQDAKLPGREIPWVVTTLAESILKHNGAKTEGIFRVPGDIDAVNTLKVRLDKFEVSDDFNEPHVPGSALKLWFRELREPLIPAELYESCISAFEDADQALSTLDRLPDMNKKLLTYAIRFLQVIGQPDNHSATKMNYDNLAMVWAPNFLRCPSEDPMEIFQNTKKEMSYVRLLVKHLNTSSVAHLGLELTQAPQP